MQDQTGACDRIIDALETFAALALREPCAALTAYCGYGAAASAFSSALRAGIGRSTGPDPRLQLVAAAWDRCHVVADASGWGVPLKSYCEVEQAKEGVCTHDPRFDRVWDDTPLGALVASFIEARGRAFTEALEVATAILIESSRLADPDEPESGRILKDEPSIVGASVWEAAFRCYRGRVEAGELLPGAWVESCRRDLDVWTRFRSIRPSLSGLGVWRRAATEPGV